MSDEVTQAVPTFDADAFKTSIMDEINKTLNGFAKTLNKDLEKKLAAPKPEPVIGNDPDAGVTNDPKLTPAENAAMAKLTREQKTLSETVANLTRERDAANNARMESERVTAIKDAMSGIQFRDEASSKSFFKIVSGDITRDEDGQLVAKTDNGFLPVGEYVKGTAETLPGLLAARGSGGGSGAVNGKTVNSQFNLDDIKPGMTAETRAAILSKATSLLPQQG